MTSILIFLNQSFLGSVFSLIHQQFKKHNASSSVSSYINCRLFGFIEPLTVCSYVFSNVLSFDLLSCSLGQRSRFVKPFQLLLYAGVVFFERRAQLLNLIPHSTRCACRIRNQSFLLYVKIVPDSRTSEQHFIILCTSHVLQNVGIDKGDIPDLTKVSKIPYVILSFRLAAFRLLFKMR